MTRWHHKAKVENVGGVKIFRSRSKWIYEGKKKNSQSEARTSSKKNKKIKKQNKKETSFPIKPGGGSRLSDCPVIGRFQRQQSKTKADRRSCWCHAPLANHNQFLCFCHHHRGNSLLPCCRKEHSHWLVLTFREKVIKSQSARRSTRPLPQCLAPCGRGLDWAANSHPPRQ